MAGPFELNIARFVEKAKGNLDLVVRRVSQDIISRVIEQSPVGNPDLWKSNKGVIYRRETYNLFAQQINAGLAPGEKPIRILRPSTLKKKYQLKAGKGYVGGRFKSNWLVSVGSIPAGTTVAIDISGAITRAEAAVLGMKAGDVIYLVNNLPYARALEYGHSTQAPAGMVRLTVTEFGAIVDKAAGDVPK